VRVCVCACVCVFLHSGRIDGSLSPSLAHKHREGRGGGGEPHAPAPLLQQVNAHRSRVRITMVAPARFEECADSTWLDRMRTLPTHVQFTQEWKSLHKIGSGTFGKVWCAELKQRPLGTSSVRRAAKVMQCPAGQEHTYMRWATAWQIFERLRGHPNVVALHHMFFAPLTCLELAKLVLVIDLCDRDLSPVGSSSIRSSMLRFCVAATCMIDTLCCFVGSSNLGLVG
jgi:hypothetical protein